MNKYPTWYKVIVYGLYVLIAITLIALFLIKTISGYYEAKAELLNNEHTIRFMAVQQASWYDYELKMGLGHVCNRVAKDCYTEHHLTGASRDYKRGTSVGVCRLGTDKCVVVKITDYIEHPERNIDLSSYAFSQLGSLSEGLISVTIKEVK